MQFGRSVNTSRADPVNDETEITSRIIDCPLGFLPGGFLLRFGAIVKYLQIYSRKDMKNFEPRTIQRFDPQEGRIYTDKTWAC